MMKELTSYSDTFFMKKGFPIILLLFCIPMVFDVSNGFGEVVPMCAFGLGFCYWKYFILICVDHVYDYEEYLIIKNAGKKIYIPINNIHTITYQGFGKNKRVICTLKNQTELGTVIYFIPKRKGYGKHQDVLSLVYRVKQLRLDSLKIIINKSKHVSSKELS